MKKHFKLIFAALSALLLFVSNTPAVSAAENDKTQIGGSFVDNNGKEWAYSGTFKSYDEKGQYYQYTFYSDERIVILHEPNAPYRIYAQGGIYYDWSSRTVDRNGFATMGKSTETAQLETLGSVYFNLTKPYASCTATVPIFETRTELSNYYNDGDMSGCVNPDDLELPVQEKGLPFLQNVAWTSIADCYGGMPYIMGDEISWAVNNFPWRDGGKVELYADFQVTAFNNSISEIAAGLSDTIIFNVSLTSSDFESVGLGFTAFGEGKVIIPDDKVEALVQSKLDSVYGNGRYKYISHKRLHFYVRCVWRNVSLGKTLLSRWTRVTPGGSIDDFGHVVTGDIGEIENGQFTFTEDTESEGSYEYNKDFSGNYPFDKDGNDSGIKVPTSIEDALLSFVDIIGALLKSMGKVPALVKTVFGFLPNLFFVLIGCSFTVIVILRILGR